MDVLLILIAIVIAVMVVGMNFILLVTYSHPEDKNQAWTAKIIVIAGLSLAAYGILLLPLDVANRNSVSSGSAIEVSGLPMSDLWEIVLIGIIVMLLGVIPFAIFYYEESGEGIATQLKRGLIYGVITLLSGLAVITIVSAIVGPYAKVPVTTYSAEVGTTCNQQEDPNDIYTVKVSYPIMAVAIVSLVGWVFFSVFAGVGLVALPIDLLQTWFDRPTNIDVKNWATKRNELKERASKLRGIGEKLEVEHFKDSKLTGSDKKLFNKFKTAVYLLEKDYEVLRVRKYEKGGNILYYLMMGILGVIGVGVSLLWVIHTVVFSFLHNMSPFLNTMLVGLDKALPLLGTVGYGTFSFYLLWCTVKGVMKLGVRFAFFTIHPMEKNKTMMNSFLFNVGIILLCEIPVIQFCSSAFKIYSRVTAVNVIFDTQIQYIPGISYMWRHNIYLMIMFAFVALTALYLAVKKPKDNSKEFEKSVEQELKLKGIYL